MLAPDSDHCYREAFLATSAIRRGQAERMVALSERSPELELWLFAAVRQGDRRPRGVDACYHTCPTHILRIP